MATLPLQRLLDTPALWHRPVLSKPWLLKGALQVLLDWAQPLGMGPGGLGGMTVKPPSPSGCTMAASTTSAPTGM
jgi:hypothetical protein